MQKKLLNISNPNLKNYSFNTELWDYVERVIARYEPSAIILFGSLTRGDYWHDSDADIIVILNEKRVNHLTKGLELRELGYKMPLDLFVYGTMQFEDMVASGNLLALDAMEYGKPLHIGDESYWNKLAATWRQTRNEWQPTEYGWKGKQPA